MWIRETKFSQYKNHINVLLEGQIISKYSEITKISRSNQWPISSKYDTAHLKPKFCSNTGLYIVLTRKKITIDAILSIANRLYIGYIWIIGV